MYKSIIATQFICQLDTPLMLTKEFRSKFMLKKYYWINTWMSKWMFRKVIYRQDIWYEVIETIYATKRKRMIIR